MVLFVLAAVAVAAQWSKLWLLQAEIAPESVRVYYAPAGRTVSLLSLPEASDTTLRWLVVGDWGTGGRTQRRVAQGMAALCRRAPVHFVVSTGDNIYPSGVRSAADPQWESKFEQIYADSCLHVPWYPVLGNHDYRGNPDAQIAYSQRNPRWQMPGRYYSHTHLLPDGTAVLFVALDTQELLFGTPRQREQQLRWLEQELREFPETWKFAVGHHPLRSAGAYGENRLLLQLLKPLFDRYGVAIYFCGHEHDLQLLKHPEDRFVCVVSGAGGGVRSTSYGPASLFAAAEPGFVYVALEKRKARLWFIRADATVLFTADIPKPGGTP